MKEFKTSEAAETYFRMFLECDAGWSCVHECTDTEGVQALQFINSNGTRLTRVYCKIETRKNKYNIAASFTVLAASIEEARGIVEGEIKKRLGSPLVDCWIWKS